MTELLGLLIGADESESTARLKTRLASQSEVEGVLDIAYRTMDTPVGSLLLAATPLGVVRVAFEVQDHAAVLADLADRISPRILRAGARLDGAVRQIDGYFDGKRTQFDVPLDLRLARGFRRTVLDRLAMVGFGRTVTYGALAREMEAPGASRAVGTACARNPVPLLLPCHRVVRSDGSVGEYAGGSEAKRRLLSLESERRHP